MRSLFRVGFVAAALSVAILAPGAATAAVELQDYAFSAVVPDYLGQTENFAGAFTLAHDDTTDAYGLVAIDFTMFGHAFSTLNTFAAPVLDGVQISGVWVRG